jgi:K+-sensing histidine kinase KdpD
LLACGARRLGSGFSDARIAWIRWAYHSGWRPHLIRRYAIALLFVAAAFVSTLLLQRFFPYPFLFLFFAAVMASAWFGGTAAGIVAVLVSTLLVDYFFLPPYRTFSIQPTDIAYFAAFIVCALAASWVSAAQRKAEEALRQARDQLELRVAERTSELQKSLTELQEKEHQRLLLQTEKSALSDKLEARKVVDRAKGILQRDLKLSEEDAYRTLQRESQQTRRSMKEIAESIILRDELKRGST